MKCRCLSAYRISHRCVNFEYIFNMLVHMLEKLNQLLDDVEALQVKLILLVGTPGVGKTSLLSAFGKSRGSSVLNIGTELGRRLSAIPQKQRHLHANSILRELADQRVKDGILLVDNIELLFDRTLQLNPLDLLKRYAHGIRVVAIWPGRVHNGRLVYAEMGHAEFQDYPVEGFVPFELQQ